MKKFLFFFCIGLSAQQPICRIIDYSNFVKMISFGPALPTSERCGFWINSPTPGQIQIACYANSQVVKNEVAQILPKGINGGYTFPDGVMQWIIEPGKIHMSGAGSDGAAIEKDETF
jgi:hypothetical protein